MDSLKSLSIEERKLVVGIDFGTTFSGIVWAETRRPDDQHIIESWPASLEARDGASSVKIPTELRYRDGKVEWGLQIPQSVDRAQWFKLLLKDDDSQDNPIIIDGIARTPETLTADYLTQLNAHLMYTLEKNLGAAILRTIPIEFCLTVPAIWSELAQDKTLKACQQAGLKSNSEILLVSEPEAAVIYTLSGLDPVTLNPGDTFVLCDAGGGTVDLISYTIVESTPRLKIKEAAPGTGGLCGSTFLNRRFITFLRGKLETEPDWGEDILAEAVDRFDTTIKKQYSAFTGTQELYYVPVPGMANNVELGIRRGRLAIKSADIARIFEPIIVEILKLIDDQIKATDMDTKAVVLVGGFGQSVYLRERISRAMKTIPVIQPPNAWTAIARGAAMMGLARANSGSRTISVVSRSARKHYGINLATSFIAGTHDINQRYWCKKHASYRVPAMHWFIERGDAVREDTPYEIAFDNHYLVEDGKPDKCDIAVYFDSQSSVSPVHMCASVSRLVNLRVDLSQLSQKTLDATIKTLADKKKYYRLKATIEATFRSASTKYILKCQGLQYDVVTADYY